MLDARLQDLFARPPAEFTAARNALAKELRAAGREEEAKQAAALRRPTAPVWAVNQLARRSTREIEALLEASEKVRKAQLQGARGDELRAAMAAQREALAKLEGAAEQILRGAGMQVSAAATRAVQSTLQAAATGRAETKEKLRQGMLEEELGPSGFEALLGAGPQRPSRSTRSSSSHHPPSSTSASSKAAARGEARKRREEEREAKRRAAQRARELHRVESQARKLDERATTAERAAKQAREAADAARDRLQRLRS